LYYLLANETCLRYIKGSWVVPTTVFMVDFNCMNKDYAAETQHYIE